MVVLRPERPNGLLLVEIPNRGRKLIGPLVEGSSTAASGRLEQAGDAGRGFLLSRGYTLAWIGWQGDIAPGAGMGIRLPVLAGVRAGGTIDMPAPAVSQSLVSRRVLVVDDNADSADALALLLRLDGHLVETANDGRRAVELAERFQPDAILLDLGMPGMNGYEVCEEIRARPWGSSVLMVAQTGWGQAQDRARTLDAGFDAHLTKPIDPDAVQEMLVTLKVHS